MRVLIVEDNPSTRRSFKSKLDKLGYEVFGEANSVEAAQRLVEKSHPDVAILDIDLGGKKTGIDLARDFVHREIPFVFISGMQDDATFEQVKTLSPGCFLEKPVSLINLRNHLSLAMAKGQKAEARQSQNTNRTHLPIKTNGGKIDVVQMEDILHLKASGNLCEVIVLEPEGEKNDKISRKILASSALGPLLKNHLSEVQFIQVHRSHVVHLLHIKQILGDEIILSDKSRVPIGDTYRKRFMEMLNPV